MEKNELKIYRETEGTWTYSDRLIILRRYMNYL